MQTPPLVLKTCLWSQKKHCILSKKSYFTRKAFLLKQGLTHPQKKHKNIYIKFNNSKAKYTSIYIVLIVGKYLFF